jgi:hypothetical protein
MQPGVPKVEHEGKTLRYIVIHDPRHTLASHGTMKGGAINVQKILVHRSMQMTER